MPPKPNKQWWKRARCACGTFIDIRKTMQCRRCYDRSRGEVYYRRPTPDERALLDDARVKLATAFIGGDWDTVDLAHTAIHRVLAKMRK